MNYRMYYNKTKSIGSTYTDPNFIVLYFSISNSLTCNSQKLTRECTSVNQFTAMENLPEKLAMCVHSSITPFMKLIDSLCKDRSQHSPASVFFSWSEAFPWTPLGNEEKHHFPQSKTAVVLHLSHQDDKFCASHVPLHNLNKGLHLDSLLQILSLGKARNCFYKKTTEKKYDFTSFNSFNAIIHLDLIFTRSEY